MDLFNKVRQAILEGRGEQIDELSKDTMLKYLSANKKSASGGMGDKEATKRMRGADMATRKYTARDNKYVRVPATEEAEIEEDKNLTGLPKSTAEKNKQYIEVTHVSGNKKRVPVHPTNAYKALNHYRSDPTTKSARIVSEDVEDLEELSTKTLTSYRNKARGEIIDADANDDTDTYNKRIKGYTKAKQKITRNFVKGVDEEAEQIDEISAKTKGEYAKKASDYIMNKAHSMNPDEVKKWNRRQKGMKMVRKEEVEQVNEDVEDLDELSRETVGRYSLKAKSIADNEGGKDRSVGRMLAGRKRWGGSMKGVAPARVPATEEVEDLDELSDATLKSYAKKAMDQATAAHGYQKDAAHAGDHEAYKREMKHKWKRQAGARNAIDRIGNNTLAKEEAEQIDEDRISNVRKITDKAGHDAAADVLTHHGFSKIGNQWSRGKERISKHTDPNSGKSYYHYKKFSSGRKPPEEDSIHAWGGDKTIGHAANLHHKLSEEAEIDEVLDTPEKAINYIKKSGDSFKRGDETTQNKRYKGAQALARKQMRTNEEAEQIDEVGDTPAGKRALGRYIKDRRGTILGAGMGMQQQNTDRSTTDKQRKDLGRRASNAFVGVSRAVDRLTKEEAQQVDELSDEMLKSYSKKALEQSRTSTGDKKLKRQVGARNAIDRLGNNTLAKEETEQIDEGTWEYHQSKYLEHEKARNALKDNRGYVPSKHRSAADAHFYAGKAHQDLAHSLRITGKSNPGSIDRANRLSKEATETAEHATKNFHVKNGKLHMNEHNNVDEGFTIRSKGYGNVQVVKGGKVIKTFTNPQDARMHIAKINKMMKKD